MPALAALIALAAPSTGRALQRPMSLGALCARSALVVVGEVTGLESMFSADGSGRIETWADVAVVQTLRGDPPREGLRVLVPGGAAAGLRLTVEDAPTLRVDAPTLLLLTPLERGAGWAVLGGEAGARPVQRGARLSLADLEGCHAP